jgi:hypothetical protein
MRRYASDREVCPHCELNKAIFTVIDDMELTPEETWVLLSAFTKWLEPMIDGNWPEPRPEWVGEWALSAHASRDA